MSTLDPSSSLARRAWVNPLLAVVVLLLGACTSVQRPGRLSEEDISKLQAVLEQAAASRQSPGLVMAVQVGEAPPWLGATGCQDEACHARMTSEARFRIGSITKSFVGAALLQQADEGKLSLEDTLEQWLPGVFAHIDGRGITLRQLLNHTSGIESFTDSVEWNVAVYTSPTRAWNAPGELLALADALRAANPRVSAPGARFLYSNTNYVLLGMIAAKADGHAVTDWRTVIQTRFFDRLALRHSRLPGRGEVGLDSTNRGYINFYNLYANPQTGSSDCVALTPPCENKDVDITEQDMSNADAAGAIVSTAEDLLVWTRALAQGALLSPGLREQQRAFASTCAPDAPSCDARAVQVGLGLFRQPRYGFIGIKGEIFGFNGTIQYLPEKDLSVVVLSNRTALDGFDVGAVPEEVAAALYPDLRTSSP